MNIKSNEKKWRNLMMSKVNKFFKEYFWLYYDMVLMVALLGMVVWTLWVEKNYVRLLFVLFLYGFHFIGTNINIAAEKISNKIDYVWVAISNLHGYGEKEINVKINDQKIEYSGSLMKEQMQDLKEVAGLFADVAENGKQNDR